MIFRGRFSRWTGKQEHFHMLALPDKSSTRSETQTVTPLLFIYSIFSTKIMILKSDLGENCFWIKTRTKKNTAQFILVPIFITIHSLCSGFHHQKIFLLTLEMTCRTRGAQVNVVSRQHFRSWVNRLCQLLAVEFRWLKFSHDETNHKFVLWVYLLPLLSLITTLQ